MTAVHTEPRRRTGRPPLTSRTDLLAAARTIGFERLTVGAVTARCGVKYSTFYRHFGSLEELRAELVDDVLAEVPWPTGGAPREHLTALSVALGAVVEQWPGLAGVLRQTPSRRLPSAKRIAVAALAHAGFERDAVAVVDAVVSLVLDGRAAGIDLVLRGMEARR